MEKVHHNYQNISMSHPYPLFDDSRCYANHLEEFLVLVEQETSLDSDTTRFPPAIQLRFIGNFSFFNRKAKNQ